MGRILGQIDDDDLIGSHLSDVHFTVVRDSKGVRVLNALQFGGYGSGSYIQKLKHEPAQIRQINPGSHLEECVRLAGLHVHCEQLRVECSVPISARHSDQVVVCN